MVRRYTPDPRCLGGMNWAPDGQYVYYLDHEAALKAKEQEIAKLRLENENLDRLTTMQEQGIKNLHEITKGYDKDRDTLMAQAVRFALEVNSADTSIPVRIRRQATAILTLPEVQAWRKEAR